LVVSAFINYVAGIFAVYFFLAFFCCFGVTVFVLFLVILSLTFCGRFVIFVDGIGSSLALELCCFHNS